MSAEHTGGDGPDPVAVLGDLPAPLWGPLLRVVRRAVDRLPRADLPAALRPYAGWTPDSLAAPRPRRAVAEAIARDHRLREEIGAALDNRPALDAASQVDGARLVDAHGEDRAVVALVARGRWRELAVVAADAAERLASRDRSAAEVARRPGQEQPDAARQRLSADLAVVRGERDAQRRRADAADERARREEAARREQAAEIARLRERLAVADERLVEERRHRDRRVGRLQRRLEEAGARARVDHARVAAVLNDLERLTAELRAALEPGEPGAPEDPLPASEAAGEGPGAVVPRSVGAAAPGRPCRLPLGIPADGPAAVQALLQVPGLEAVLDGYNLTKDVRGRPQVGLAEQRQWLVKHAGGVAARYGRRLTVVFDGTERLAPPPAARGVRVVFTAGEEIADERVQRIVEGLPANVPVLVVSSDREVRRAAEQLGADVVSSGAFLAATGA